MNGGSFEFYSASPTAQPRGALEERLPTAQPPVALEGRLPTAQPPVALEGRFFNPHHPKMTSAVFLFARVW